MEEVEIDLGEPNDSGELDNGEEAQRLWKAVPVLEEDEDIHTSALVEISDTKPLIDVRDPRGINDCLKVLHLKCPVFNLSCKAGGIAAATDGQYIPTGI